MANKKETVIQRFPKNKILETKSLQGEYCLLSALLNDEDEYTVDEAIAIVAEYKNREVK